MLSDIAINYILLFILLELYEVGWQKAKTILGMLAKMYQYYSKNIFVFFLMHPTFYFSIALVMLSNYNIYALILLSIKTLDIVTKIILLQKVFIKKDLSKDLTDALLTPLHNLFPYIGLMLYPPLIAFCI